MKSWIKKLFKVEYYIEIHPNGKYYPKYGISYLHNSTEQGRIVKGGCHDFVKGFYSPSGARRIIQLHKEQSKKPRKVKLIKVDI
jgi:hypothetical protein